MRPVLASLFSSVPISCVHVGLFPAPISFLLCSSTAIRFSSSSLSSGTAVPAAVPTAALCSAAVYVGFSAGGSGGGLVGTAGIM